MPRRAILTDMERKSLFTLPDNQKGLILHYCFSESDISIIRQHRGAANKIGFAIQLCYMRYPGIILAQRLDTVDQLAASNNLPDALINNSGLQISPLVNSVPEEANILMKQAYELLPHVKITELLMEVDEWTNFTRHFTHVKNGNTVKDKTLLLTAILADAINPGLSKMAESCPGATFQKLSWLQAWHIRDETYSASLAELINEQCRHPFAANWGDGTTSSSDGQRFKAGGHAERTGQVNPKYGNEPGVLFYTHISNQYAPFGIRCIWRERFMQ